MHNQYIFVNQRAIFVLMSLIIQLRGCFGSFQYTTDTKTPKSYKAKTLLQTCIELKPCMKYDKKGAPHFGIQDDQIKQGNTANNLDDIFGRLNIDINQIVIKLIQNGLISALHSA